MSTNRSSFHACTRSAKTVCVTLRLKMPSKSSVPSTTKNCLFRWVESLCYHRLPRFAVRRGAPRSEQGVIDERKPRAPKKEKAEKTERRKSSNKSDEGAAGPTLEEQEERMKKQLAEMTGKLRNLLEEKEKELYSKIDQAIAREKTKPVREWWSKR
ncbi:hypothetical protein OS493_039080 [Desmophyllum pertusum]|uniref:Uncharacterized protein n=1 Tax=Desmophyllum pertusum TaxID=174260 RepID=A0A9W9ZKM8_9CNID|nr:hypothetical protein OS493_039080 [Desmophyllum pertusum]